MSKGVRRISGTSVCANCRRPWKVEAFHSFSKAATGIQPWCIDCNWVRQSSVRSAWATFQRTLREKDPVRLLGWTFEMYLEKWDSTGGRCTACGAGLREWQSSGYAIDRIDNASDYDPVNCRLLCWPCNCTKGNRSTLALMAEVEMFKAKFGGPGQINWNEINPRFKRRVRPNMTKFIVEPVQLELIRTA